MTPSASGLSAAQPVATGLRWVAFAYALFVLPSDWGGRGGWTLTCAAILAALAGLVSLIPAWRSRAGRFAVLLWGAAALAASLALIPGRGEEALLSWRVFAALPGLGVAALVEAGRGRARLLAAVAGLAIVWEAAWAWYTWWGGGGGGGGGFMTGHFYWRNQFGIFVAVGVVLWTAWAVSQPGRGRVLAGVTAGALLAATYLSGSRASLALAVVGGVAAAVAIGRGWARKLLVVALVGLLGLGALALAKKSTPSDRPQGLAVRGNDAGSSAFGRLDWWRAAGEVFADHPVLGVGLGLYGKAAAPYQHGPIKSRYAHNEYLQAAAEGGTPLALAAVGVLAAGALVAWRLVRKGFPGMESGLVVGAGVLLAHAGFDFDWHYPALPALLAVLLGSPAGALWASARPTDPAWETARDA
ncbi:MAG: O-antigen ligase family protein [Actinomycetota bacterium]